MKYPDIDRIYRELPLDSIPWNNEAPPEALVNLISSGGVRPCKAVDIGCGAGNYTCYLASIGFSMTGIDGAPTAIRIARERAQREGLSCRFNVADLLGDLHEVTDTYDFGFEWGVMHHIEPEDRDTYVKNIYRILNPGASYLSVCFSEEDPQFGGTGKHRTTRVGTTLYFSSPSEIRDLLAPWFDIVDLKTIEFDSKTGLHRSVYAFSRRR